MRISAIIFAVILSVGWISKAGAHTFIYNLADGTPVFRVNLPDGWQLDLDFDPPLQGVDAPPPPRVVEAMPRDGSKLWLGAWVLTEISDIKDAREYFDSLEQYVFTDVSVEETRDSEHNGMPALVLTGTATKDLEPVEWSMALFQPKPETVAAILSVGIPEARAARRGELRAIVDSLRPAD